MNKFLHKILALKKLYLSLLDNGLSKSDLYQGIKVLRSGKITMDKKQWSLRKNLQKNFNKYALMVNSGSSANLLLCLVIQKKKKI